MDDHDAGAPGSRPDAEDTGDGRNRRPDQDYFWEGRPGEDFGPITPPKSAPPRRERPRRPEADDEPTPARVARGAEPQPTRSWSQTMAARDEQAEAQHGGRPVQAAAPRRRNRRPILVAAGALIVLVGLAAGLLMVISRQAVETVVVPEAPAPAPAQTAAAAAQAAAATAQAGGVASPGAATPGSSPVAQTPGGAASPAPAASPTPLALAPPTASPAPARSPTASRASPVVVPPPIFVTPPGGRFSTATPARLGTPVTPAILRTPPPVPTPRPSSFLSRVWSEQILNRVGDNASVCGAAATGANAQLTVIAPDRSTRVLGEFQPPAERVCYSMRLDEAGLYVLTLIVKDANGAEIDRQSGAMSAGR